VIAIDNVLVSEDIVKEQFVCDLSKCKGGCCEEGDAGAPLTDEELELMLELFEKVKPYLTSEALAEIERKGKYVYSKDFGWVTPTIGDDNGICVYGYRDEKGTIKCAYEQAFYDGVISWKKPISCHLYPIISKKGKNGNFDRMNYEPRPVLCKPACKLGESLKVPVYQFLKEPITRLYGEDFYKALEEAASMYTD
jgi:hypothetical protein